MQLGNRGLHRSKQICVIQAVYQMGNDFGVGLADKNIALGFEHGAQFVVVFNDAVVHQCNTSWTLLRVRPRAMTEVRVCIAYRWNTMGCPARMCNSQVTGKTIAGADLLDQLSHPRRAACATKSIVFCIGSLDIHRDATGVIATVLQALKPLDQNRNDIAC